MDVKQVTALCLLHVSAFTTIAFSESDRENSDLRKIDFSIAGVHIGSSLAELKDMIPQAVEGRPVNAGPMRDDHIVTLNNGTNPSPQAFFRFLKKEVISIEIHYSSTTVREISKHITMLDRLHGRFGEPDQSWREDNVDGGFTAYAWKSDDRFMSFAVFDRGNAKLFIKRLPTDILYPNLFPKTSLLGIDDKQETEPVSGPVAREILIESKQTTISN